MNDACNPEDFAHLTDEQKSDIDSLGDRWMVRSDDDGLGYGGFQWSPVGEWTECPRWSHLTIDDCESGGLFGQGPGGFGYAKYGDRFVFCETGDERISCNDKIKVRRARILHVGAEAVAALFYVCGGEFPGSLYLRGSTLPEGFSIGDVGGSLDLYGATLPKGITVGHIGGSLYLRDAVLPEGVTEAEYRARIMRARA